MSTTTANVPKLIPSIDVQVRSVLVATDFSSASDKAISHAISIARHYRAKLCLMHVVSSVALNMAGPEAVAHATSLAFQDLTSVERQLVCGGVLRDIEHGIMVREGDIWTELKEVIRNDGVDLLVIGTHGRTGLKKLVLGSVAEQIFRQAHCRVLTVSPCSPPDASLTTDTISRPLLFATDLSSASLRALPDAISLANQRGARLVVIHILSPVPQVVDNRWYTAADVMQMQAEALANARQRLNDLLANTRLETDLECIVEFGQPAERIVATAKRINSEIIVMGLSYREHIGTISHLPWFTAYDVVCGAECPVLTVRTDNGRRYRR